MALVDRHPCKVTSSNVLGEASGASMQPNRGLSSPFEQLLELAASQHLQVLAQRPDLIHCGRVLPDKAGKIWSQLSTREALCSGTGQHNLAELAQHLHRGGRQDEGSSRGGLVHGGEALLIPLPEPLLLDLLLDEGVRAHVLGGLTHILHPQDMALSPTHTHRNTKERQRDTLTCIQTHTDTHKQTHSCTDRHTNAHRDSQTDKHTAHAGLVTRWSIQGLHSTHALWRQM